MQAMTRCLKSNGEESLEPATGVEPAASNLGILYRKFKRALDSLGVEIIRGRKRAEVGECEVGTDCPAAPVADLVPLYVFDEP